MPPLRCSACKEGNTTTEPWLVLHNVLIAHGKAAAVLRSLWPAALLSCNFNTNWAVPKRDTPEDRAAVQRFLDWHLGLYADPLFFGNFPASVLASNITGLSFTPEEQQLLRGSVNYFALNHYTSNYVTDWNGKVVAEDHPLELGVNGQDRTGNTAAYAARDGVLIGPEAQSWWLNVYPNGMRSLLRYIDEYYNHPIIYVTENGVDVPGEAEMPLQQALNDTFRIDYLKGYLQSAIDAVQLDGVNLQGYCVWSLIDNFEWLEGYAFRFGMVRVDYAEGQKRTAKESAKFLATWIASGSPGPALSLDTVSPLIDKASG